MKTPLPRCIIATLAIALACLIHQAAGQTGQVLDYKTQNVTAAGITFCAEYYTLSYQLWYVRVPLRWERGACIAQNS